MISNTTDLSDHEVVPHPKCLNASAGFATRHAAGWLSLAAAPTFAIMALLTALGGSPDVLCSAAQGASPLSGMVPMYVLMSAFHSAPWLKLISGRQSGARRTPEDR
jgi:hypothetical protein